MATVAVCKRTESTESQTLSNILLHEDDLICFNVAFDFRIIDIVVTRDAAQLLNSSDCLAVDRYVFLMSRKICRNRIAREQHYCFDQGLGLELNALRGKTSSRLRDNYTFLS